jgi:hypothetical protein
MLTTIRERWGQMARKKTATVNFTLRLREDLRRRIETIAKKEKRSLNEEMVLRLEESFRRESDDKTLAEMRDLLAKVHDGLDESRRLSDERTRVIAEIEKRWRAGDAVDEVFPLNALLRDRYGTSLFRGEKKE